MMHVIDLLAFVYRNLNLYLHAEKAAPASAVFVRASFIVWDAVSQSMRRGHVRLSGMVHFFLDLDAGGGGRCLTSTDTQIYRYLV